MEIQTFKTNSYVVLNRGWLLRISQKHSCSFARFENHLKAKIGKLKTMLEAWKQVESRKTYYLSYLHFEKGTGAFTCVTKTVLYKCSHVIPRFFALFENYTRNVVSSSTFYDMSGSTFWKSWKRFQVAKSRMESCSSLSCPRKHMGRVSGSAFLVPKTVFRCKLINLWIFKRLWTLCALMSKSFV